MSLLSSGLVAEAVQAQKLNYPITHTVEQIDEYHGVKVADPFRWLEDDRSEETEAWVKAQNELTFDYLDRISFKGKIYQELEEAYNYPKYSAPKKKGDYYYFYKNDGLQNQSVLYRQLGENGTVEVVLDPNALSADATTRLTVFSLSKNGKYAVCGFSKGGSDWQEYRVMNMKTVELMSDKLEWVKVSGAAWQGDGFYYSRYPKPDGSALAAKNENHQVYFHQVGTDQQADRLVFEDPANPQRFHTVSTTEDEQFAALYVSDRGQGKDGNGLWVMAQNESTFQPIKAEISDFSYGLIEHVEDGFLIETNEQAPNGKVMKWSRGDKGWSTLIAEKPEPLQGVGSAGGKLFASYSKDVTTRIYVYGLTGALEREVPLPGLGTASGFGGEADDAFVFYTFTSFTYPPTIFRYDIGKGESTLFKKAELSFNPEDYQTKQVFFKSKDGTAVPAFITHKKGLELDGQNPTILYGYGGFNISLTPSFSATRIPFLNQGGVYVQANLRGGGEYGEKWHEQGMKLKKQNVFDDFIAAAEYLIEEKYTSSDKLALQGGSNGGLLVGTVVNQRPDICRVAFPAVGVMDMLRFHKFTIGWNWIADYGSSDNAEEFEVLYGYSPLHNIRANTSYPAVMITTADHDDRVVPAHSFKYAAELQRTAGPGSERPLLIRIDTNSGHGASNTKKALETQSDIYAFMFSNMGLTWK
ncbi:prolyl oligopeptidase [Dyadobacter jejuensis]|uniref:prolyl oligopeptidase n=2 Tax=Dyadobacter jejuensis TaxID=1082580 RepID=A0A316ART5_9BACT|nr:prolyl oligopeptidase [Dyadobacter jejuensis]